MSSSTSHTSFLITITLVTLFCFSTLIPVTCVDIRTAQRGLAPKGGGAAAAFKKAKDQPTISSLKINLVNTGLKPDGTPVQGKIVGPFTSVRTTTMPWNMRHLVGQQINGAPEPLVYSPIYQFQVTEKTPKSDWKDMFKDPNAYMMNFGTAGADMTVMGIQTTPETKSLAEPKAFENIAPQPPPFVPPMPPGSGSAGEGEGAAVAPEGGSPPSGPTANDAPPAGDSFLETYSHLFHHQHHVVQHQYPIQWVNPDVMEEYHRLLGMDLEQLGDDDML